MKVHFLKTGMLLFACFVFAFNAQAQRGKMTPEKFDAHIQKLTEQLDLNKKQVRKVTKIEQGFFEQMNAVRAEFKRPQQMKRTPKGTGDTAREKPARGPRNPAQAEANKQRRQKMSMLNNQHNNALKGVLTKAQFEKYNSVKEERNDRMRNKVNGAKGQGKAKMKGENAKTKQPSKVSAKKAEPNSQLKVNEGLKKD